MIGGLETSLLLGTCVGMAMVVTQPLPGVRGFISIIFVVVWSVSCSPIIRVQGSPRSARGWGSGNGVRCCCVGIYWDVRFCGKAEDVRDEVAFVEGAVESARDPGWLVECKSARSDFGFDDEGSGGLGCQWVFGSELGSGVLCSADED